MHSVKLLGLHVRQLEALSQTLQAPLERKAFSKQDKHDVNAVERQLAQLFWQGMHFPLERVNPSLHFIQYSGFSELQE